MASLTYESDAPAQDEEPVEAARLHELVGLVLGEAARVAEEIDEGDGDAAVHVQDQVGLLRGRDLLDVERVVEERRGGEVGLGVHTYMTSTVGDGVGGGWGHNKQSK